MPANALHELRRYVDAIMARLTEAEVHCLRGERGQAAARIGYLQGHCHQLEEAAERVRVRLERE